ncbi:ABC-F family ATP-binding cassette domain-containing protein [Lactococcus chungangensis]|jgi:ATPase components of ABC transporters with duplicated ATPase domains|uniref:ABC transporter ATP-binding protein n=2 Tax=Pseudolactococcus chungangensis TaxID=451457 RepID=A0A1K2HJS7_9LACT|nr:ATP-binding cassette domain-containing protein [Lactococcus chungangensis]NCB81884.1 ATP-binding cassette domain-containing protein [Bacilli bacterium]MDD3015522.1 ATP-binding cassette domain-containing protein [Lactococcus chungangensis]NLH35586.1 ATP-binding cassette domain-containing protein [Lactococcus chungangensis]PCS01226.1 ABC transporter ATP-binding protein [Lactococcus chungangensis CAU 28 = DSM 22330]SFZ76522.1 ATPase components of ABC transporters with duplicated ATPase domains
MLQVSDISLQFSDRKLFDEVNIKFLPGNCYGLIGANGAGKSTFLKILAGDIEPSTGHTSMGPDERMSILRQNHFDYEDIPVLDVVLMGHQRLYDVKVEKDAIYMKEDFTDEDGMRSAELEGEFAELGGWEAESDAAQLLQNLGIPDALHMQNMSELTNGEKVKVLLAQALFGKPDVLLLDEPTNGLDIQSINWLEEFLINFENTVIVVSHDRHFLNKVCTHMADLDFGKIKLFVGNYDFWKESSELALKLQGDANRKSEEKIKELQDFIARFSANASKSKQATSRKKMLDKIELDEIVPSSRKYPFINFKPDREIGNDLLKVENLSVKIDGEIILDNISFILNPGDKTAFIGQNDIQTTTLIRAIMGDIEYTGEVKWGVTTSQAYLPKDNSRDFAGGETILDWLRQFASKEEDDNTFLRGFLGRMLFSGEEVNKSVNVLSGGEKVRVMLSKLMLLKSNVLVLDDPTNHLDLESISSLNEGLTNYKGSLLFASHDHEFIQTIANHIIVISKNGVIDRIGETYDEFLENDEVQAKVKALWAD